MLFLRNPTTPILFNLGERGFLLNVLYIWSSLGLHKKLKLIVLM